MPESDLHARFHGGRFAGGGIVARLKCGFRMQAWCPAQPAPAASKPAPAKPTAQAKPPAAQPTATPKPARGAGQTDRPVLRILLQRRADFLISADQSIGILVEGDAEIDAIEGEILRLVRERRD